MNLEQLGRAVKQAQYRQHRALDAALAGAGTTVVQWDALRAIDRRPGASAHDLAAATFQTDQAFGTLAQRLLAQGLILRQAGAGRRIEHVLTPKGSRVLAEANRIADAIRAELFTALTPEDRQELARLLIKLIG